MARISIDDFKKIMTNGMPWALEFGVVLESLREGSARMRLPFCKKMLRPGGTLSGPSIMMLADMNMYAVVLSIIGPVELAVTTSFNINFLNRPSKKDLLSEGRLLKLGKRLAVIEVTLYSDGIKHLIAHATGTYSIPPRL